MSNMNGNNSKNLRPVTINELLEPSAYGPEARYQWISPQTNGAAGHFRYTKKNGSKINAKFNAAKQIIGFAPSDEDLTESFENKSGRGTTTIDLPVGGPVLLPKGAEFGWASDIGPMGNLGRVGQWVYKHPETGQFFTSNFAPAPNTPANAAANAAAPATGGRRRGRGRRQTRRRY